MQFQGLGIIKIKRSSHNEIRYDYSLGAGGRTRTGTLSPAVDFESTTSTNSITPAGMIDNIIFIGLGCTFVRLRCPANILGANAFVSRRPGHRLVAITPAGVATGIVYTIFSEIARVKNKKRCPPGRTSFCVAINRNGHFVFDTAWNKFRRSSSTPRGYRIR